MAAYRFHDQAEQQSWDRYYSQLSREETESALADTLEEKLKQRFFEELCEKELARWLDGSKAAIHVTFNDDADYLEELAFGIRRMAETIAHHHVKIMGGQ
ncbi:host-nuclease inhibitor Gam family protein [Leclercia adecarboxylata]|uniref:host-nuclease inhibitor Gam family protein n=1 Tax=Leclercia adecarboxylata TaxID=83655 RepID=UPI002DB93998|nr:host-nuclease inhibitor Gam family protein [Leclercia adecarboxylata]MEC3905276.1 host-nuclease inhibitor Gam family protein [Leclercia adecarboxylata]